MATPPQSNGPLPDWPSADQAATSVLFSPIKLGALPITDRTWVPAMVPWRASPEGMVTPELLDWYARMAEGRPGVIVVEATGIRDVPSGPLLRIGHDRFIAGLARLADVVRRHSGGQTRIFIQLIDFLRIRRRPPRDLFLRTHLAITDRHRDVLGLPNASETDVRAALVALPDARLSSVLTAREWEDLSFGARERVTDLHLPHVRDLPRDLPGWFAAAATRARVAGFDGVELHAAHAYTLASFLSAHNHRDDGYGQTGDNRIRLPVEVLQAVRAAVGDNLVVGMRLLADETIAGGYGVDDAASFAVKLAAAGADFLSFSKGGKFEDARQPPVGMPAYPYTGDSGLHCMPTLRRFGPRARGLHLPLVRQIRDAVRAAGHPTPIVAAGGVHTFSLAETALRNGDCDIVAAARQTLADPDWWHKMRTGQGHTIRRCTLTNYCEGLDQKHKAVTCKLWDRMPIDDGDRGLQGAVHDSSGRRRLVAPRTRPE